MLLSMICSASVGAFCVTFQSDLDCQLYHVVNISKQNPSLQKNVPLCQVISSLTVKAALSLSLDTKDLCVFVELAAWGSVENCVFSLNV